MKIHKVQLDTLTSPDWNPRSITDEELEKLETSLKEFGYIEPIIVNDVNNHIVGGNQRAKALKQLGYDEVDVVYVHIKDPAKEKACNIALNKISGDWDNDKLQIVLEEIELSPIDISLTGFDEIELEEFDISLDSPDDSDDDEDDFYTNENIEVKVNTGDIYQLGNHRLMCGDTTKEDEINLLIDGNKINMIYTDPPYGMGLKMDYSPFLKSNAVFKDFKGRKSEKIPNANNYEEKKIDEFQPSIITNILNLNVKETFLWGADYYTEHIPCLKDGAWFVWDKRSNSHYTTEEAQSADKAFGSTFELCWSKTKHRREIARFRWQGIFGMLEEFDRKRHHPTQKPIKLSVWFINKFSKDNDNVLDLCGGSGSTLIACEQTNRNCYMMEIDPYYCQLIINRWEDYTGQKAIKIN